MKSHASPPHRRWMNQPIVREIDKGRARWLWGVFAAFLLASAPFGAYLLQQNACLSLSIKAAAQRQELDLLEEERLRLSMEYNRRTSLHRIEPWALETHGLVRPLPEHTIVVGLSRNAMQAP